MGGFREKPTRARQIQFKFISSMMSGNFIPWTSSAPPPTTGWWLSPHVIFKSSPGGEGRERHFFVPHKTRVQLAGGDRRYPGAPCAASALLPEFTLKSLLCYRSSTSKSFHVHIGATELCSAFVHSPRLPSSHNDMTGGPSSGDGKTTP